MGTEPVQVVSLDGKEVALFNVGGKSYALADRCPHRGGPLSRGAVEWVWDRWAVRCPLHGWLFDLKSGRCLNQPDACTQAYAVDAQGHLTPRPQQPADRPPG